MAINITLVDTEGQDWDFQSGLSVSGSGLGSGLGVVNGETDTFDSGIVLNVDGAGINPQIASLDFNGRELNTIPVLTSNGVAVTRSILVSDATISAIGFARFLDSFTNTTNADVTFTASWSTNSGADSTVAIQATSSGDTTLTTADVGFVVDDFSTTAGDSAWGFAYGNGKMPPPSSATQSLGTGSSLDLLTVQHSITLKPGETKSLLSFSVQNNTAADSIADYTKFTRPLNDMRNDNFLAGLSETEISQVVNYSYIGGNHSNGPLGLTVLTDGEGNRWGVNNNRMGVQTLDTDVLREANPGEVLFQNFKTNPTTTIAEDGQEATFQGTFSTSRTGSYSVMASPEDGYIRVMMRIDYTFTAQNATFLGDYGLKTIFASAQNLVGDRNIDGSLGDGVLTIGDGGVVLDDSVSGGGGTRPAVTLVFGDTSTIDATNPSSPTGNDTEEKVQLSGTSFVATDGPPLVSMQNDTFALLYYIALNDDGLGGVADLAKLIKPDYKALAGLSAFEITKIKNFTLTEADRLKTTDGDDDDNTIKGDYWGDHILAGDGNDTLIGLGSDDYLEGQGGNDRLLGGISDDALYGGAGQDLLDGGAGNDLMQGDDDNDIFIVDSVGDKIIDAPGQGTLDWVKTSVSYDLRNAVGGGDPLQIEQLTTTLDSGTTLIDLTGDAITQTIRGNAGSNVLDDGGAGGADKLAGLAGDDTYVVHNAGDTVSEGAAEGTLDVLQTSVTFALAAGVYIEQMQTTNATGKGAINLTGNALAQSITGNDGVNVLSDGGAGGADTMTGRAGSDTYIVNNANDKIVEVSNGGSDTVNASVSFTLASSNWVEVLQTTSASGSAAINLTGNNIAQGIIGNSGANKISGLGGDDLIFGLKGNDTLSGGTGKDTFYFNTQLSSASNVDTITDFNPVDDTMKLDDAIFTKLSLGNLSSDAFFASTAGVAHDLTDRILYDTDSGALFYDADGNKAGGVSGIKFAIVGLNLALSEADFVVS